MTTLSIYFTHNKNLPLKTFPKRFSQLILSNQSSELDLFITAFYQPEEQRVTLVDHDTNIQFDAANLPLSKQLEDFFICIDANFGMPAHIQMTSQTIDCINRLNPSYLTLFSNTPRCLSNAYDWAAEHRYLSNEPSIGTETQASLSILPPLKFKPVQLKIVEQAFSSMSSHLSLIEKSNSGSRSCSRSRSVSHYYSSFDETQSGYGHYIEIDNPSVSESPIDEPCFKSKFEPISEMNDIKAQESVSQLESVPTPLPQPVTGLFACCPSLFFRSPFSPVTALDKNLSKVRPFQYHD